MKSSELHRLILKNGWRSIRQAGSHVIYEKDGKTVSVPFHGSKEMGSGIARRLSHCERSLFNVSSGKKNHLSYIQLYKESFIRTDCEQCGLLQRLQNRCEKDSGAFDW